MEKVYENAMIVELDKSGISYDNQYPITVFYEGKSVGNFIADFIIDGKIIIELKAIKNLSQSDENQLLNYLTATKYEVGLLMNFGNKAEFKRKVYDNDLKKYND